MANEQVAGTQGSEDQVDSQMTNEVTAGDDPVKALRQDRERALRDRDQAEADRLQEQIDTATRNQTRAAGGDGTAGTGGTRRKSGTDK